MGRKLFSEEYPLGEFGSEVPTQHTIFMNLFVDQMIRDKELEPYLYELSPVVSDTHMRQAESGDINHSFFYLLGPEWEARVRPAYDRAKKLAKNRNLEIVDLDNDKNRAIHKEISQILSERLGAIVNEKLKRKT